MSLPNDVEVDEVSCRGIAVVRVSSDEEGENRVDAPGENTWTWTSSSPPPGSFACLY